MFFAHGCLGPDFPDVHHAEPIAAGDRISREQRQPYFDVVAVVGDWAWVVNVDTQYQTVVYHAHFQRSNVVALRAAA